MQYAGRILVVRLLLMQLLLSCATQLSPDTCEVLYLLNVIPYPDNRTFAGWDRGFELIPAGHLATKHINSDPSILPGFKVEVIDVSSEACGIDFITDGLLEFYKAVLDPCVFGIVGLYCSTVTNAIAPIGNHRMFGHVILAASSSPEHRDTSMLPETFHTIASSRVFNKAMIAMMNEFGWIRLNIVHDALGIYFRTTANDLVQLINSDPTKLLLHRTPILPNQISIKQVFDIIDEEEARVGFFVLSEGESSALLCEA